MMKIINVSLVLLMSVIFINVNAQERIQNKNGVDILPESGDIALGANVVPILNIIGNITAGNDKFLNNMFGQNAIFAKYMLNEKTALRANFNFNINIVNNNNFVIDNTMNSPDSLVSDHINLKNQTYGLSLGYEMRRGEGRIQGIFGGDVAFLVNSSKRSFDYGNAFGIANQAPTSTDWSANGNPNGSSPQGERVSEINSGSTFGVGLRPFIGIEYFFAPRISIGAEFGWTLMFSTSGEGERINEYYSPSDDEIYNRTLPSAGGNQFNAGIDNLNGAVTCMFYF